MATVFWFIVLIGILIFAHEGGHFLFAKLFNVKVLTFSLGFGKPIRFGKFKLSFQPGETEYRIAWFPAGGFVRMLGDDYTEEVPEQDRPRAFSTQMAWKRFLIILGGPMFSILLALPIFFVVHVVRDKAPAPVVGLVEPGSPAERAGLRAGDRVVRVGMRSVENWEEVEEAVQDTGGDPIEVEVERGGKRFVYELTPREQIDETGLKLLGEQWELGLRHVRQGSRIGVVSGSPAERSGLHLWAEVRQVCGVPVRGWEDIWHILQSNQQHLVTVTALQTEKLEVGAVTINVRVVIDAVLRPEPPQQAPPATLHTASAYTGLEPVDLYIHHVNPDSPADELGLRPGDRIVGVGGKRIHSWEEFTRAILDAPEGSDLALEVRHQQEVRKLSFTPGIIEETNDFKQTTRKRGLGVAYFHNFESGVMMPRTDRLLHAFEMAFVDTGNAIVMNVVGFVRIFEGRVPATEAIGGPLMIASIARKSAERGWDFFVRMMALLSILLGLLNLLPIPILDGGHIAFILVEAALRRPVSITARVIASYIGLILLVGLMVFAFGNDIHRYWEDITSFFK